MTELEKLELKLKETVEDYGSHLSSIESRLGHLLSLGCAAEATLADMASIVEDTRISWLSRQESRTYWPEEKTPREQETETEGRAESVNISDLGKVLTLRRFDSGLTLRELGSRIGVSASTLSRIENNAVSPPSVPTLKAISRWLGLSIEVGDE